MFLKREWGYDRAMWASVSEREEGKKGGKEAAGACVSLSPRDFFEKKNKPPEKQEPPPPHELWSRRENKQDHILNLIMDGVRWSKRAEGISGTGRQRLNLAWMKCESIARAYTLLLEECTQICRWSNMRAEVQWKWKVAATKKGEKFSKMYVQ